MQSFGTAAAAFACWLALSSAAAAQAPQGTAQATAPAVVEQVILDEAGERLMLVIWHPAAVASSGSQGDAAAPADTGARRLPLVVISHGTGAGPMAHVDTAQALAAAGFVVAAPMHRGDNFQDDRKVGRPQWMVSRSRDVTKVIDYMLQSWSGRGQLNGNAVGIFGFSAGATTALISAGGVPDLARVAPHCAAQREFVCDIMVAQADAGAMPPSGTHDRRVAAAVLAAPGLGFAFEPSGLASVTIPVQLWVGEADQIVPYATNAGVVRRLIRGPVDFQRVDKAGHLSFLAPCGPESPPQICEDNEGFDRAAFHRSFNESVVAFFRRHLTDSSHGQAGASQ